MDHVIKSMQNWLDVFEEQEGQKDKKAIKCIENAIQELQKYYPERDNPYSGFHDVTKED